MNDKSKVIDKNAIDTEMDFNKPVVDSEQELQKVDDYQPPMIQQTQQDRFVEMALQSGDMEKLEKMLELKERFDKEEARKAFTAALAAFKSEDVNIVKDRNVSFKTNAGVTSYAHASLGNIVKISVPIMSKHGLSHRWLTEQLDGGIIRVTCVLTHKGGHSESTSLQAAPDDSGKKNNIQRVSSTITYLERYTYLAITGLAVEEQDDDGVGSEPPVEIELIAHDQVLTIDAKITDNGLSMDIFMGWVSKFFPGVEKIEQLPAEFYGKVISKIDESIKHKKAE